ncbi:MAG: asparagine synthase (glutamine-hydrolyzing) [Ignavibacteria bacterium]|nr:asparagine synthase (glutamine-hydrolyzing) [Ignavibacteria bacterium]
MCGIIGFIGIGNKEILERCTTLLEHRGPDDAGVEWFDKWNSGFGHRRLSIIDLSKAGHQPMSSADGRYWITYNGEVFNYADVKKELEELKNEDSSKPRFIFKSKSDTEVILYAYMAWGEKCLDKFNGMFAFAIFDTLKGEVFIVRDRLGIKPLYFTEVDEGLIFASEAKAFLKSGLIKLEPDYYALKTPMHYQVAPLTGFDGIYKLEAGHFIKYKLKHSNDTGKNGVRNNSADRLAPITGNIKKILAAESNGSKFDTGLRDDITRSVSNLEITRWWEIKVSENDNRSEKELVDELDELLNDSVRLQMVSDVPVGLFLSGGLDSSIIAALMRKHYKGSINAFTIKFSKDDQKFEKLEDDSYWAKKVADLFEFNYEEMIVKPETEKLLPHMVYHLDEPVADPAAINTYLISKFARQNNIKVLLSGMGGDEIFAGYRKQLACLRADTYKKYIPKLIRNWVERYYKNIHVASSIEGFKLNRWIKRFLSFASYERFERFLLSDIGLNIKDYENVFNNSIKYTDSFYYLKEKKLFDEIDASYLTKMCYCDTNTFMISHNLIYSDKASMMAGVETRPPLIDHRIVEFMFRLPPKYRINGNKQKYLLKKVAERYLPKNIVNRPKAPFGSPLRSWVKGVLASDIDKKLSIENISKKKFLNAEKIRDIVMRDRSGKEDLAHVVYRFLVLMTWWDTFFTDSFF